ncbi:MAG TPA: hypothetical protein VEH27_06070 [Methylomirabilota bacterium]|nr:hypothetical protein [Methylomirabilota bacterium]
MKALKLCLLLWSVLLTKANDELDTWTEVGKPVGLTNYSDIVYGEGKWVIIGTHAWISADGESWSVAQKNVNGLKLLYGNGIFLASGSAGLIGPQNYATSEDGITWTKRALSTDGLNVLIHFDGRQFLYATHERVYRSNDAITWTHEAIPIERGMLHAVEGQHYWVSNSTNSWVSTNLQQWSIAKTRIAGATMTFKDRYYGISNAGLEVSEDAVSWTRIAFPQTVSVRKFGVFGDVAIFRSQAGDLWSSQDGLSWTKRQLPSLVSVNAFATDGTRVIILDDLKILMSKARSVEAPQIEAGIRAVVQIKGGRGRTYEIQSREDAAAGEWVTEEVLQVSSEDFVWTDPKPLNNRKVYRAVAR